MKNLMGVAISFLAAALVAGIYLLYKTLIN